MPEVTPTSDFESIALRGGAVSKSINRWFQSFIDSMQAWMQVPPLNYTLKKKTKTLWIESWKGLSKQQGALCAGFGGEKQCRLCRSLRQPRDKVQGPSGGDNAGGG